MGGLARTVGVSLAFGIAESLAKPLPQQKATADSMQLFFYSA